MPSTLFNLMPPQAHNGSSYLSLKSFSLLTLLLITGIAGCEAEPAGQGPGRREQVLGLTPDQEIEIGRYAFQEITRQAESVESGPQIDQVRRVSNRIAKAVTIEPLQREINLQVSDTDFEWEYAVLKDDQLNAFCLPGGKIIVLTGLLEFVENDDQLAAVIAHEVAHALAHHASERIARERTSGRGLLSLAYNREQESEADHIGAFLMTFAGYDPEEAVSFWRQMQASRRSDIHLPEFLSDHPNDARRMQQLQDWVLTAKAGKAAYDAGRIAPASQN